MTRSSKILLLFGAVILTFAILLGAMPGTAAPLAQEPTNNPNLSISDEYCLSCHGQPGQTLTLEDGSTLDLTVNPEDHTNSVHGSAGYACVQCHSNVGEYPHPPFTAADSRDATLQLNRVCERCHASQYELAMDSVHAHAIQEGKRAAAVCSDCHTAHAVQDWVDEATGETLPEARTRIPETCAQCHYDIYQEYEDSVHGSALTDENNPDVPTCIDCHGVHNIEDPTTAEFRLASPKICADCHADPARMTHYGISTDVVNTYVADFHGTTVAIFEAQSPDAETNKPVCYDCHGVHNIKRADDPEKGLQVKENLLATCQKCHPNAEDNFPTAWLSHYIPSPEKFAVVYYVNLFYKLLIPTLIGGMALLVVLDGSRLLINKRKHQKAYRPVDAQPPAQPIEETSLAPEDPEQPPEQPDEEVMNVDETSPEAVEPVQNDETPGSQDEPGEEAKHG